MPVRTMVLNLLCTCEVIRRKGFVSSKASNVSAKARGWSRMSRRYSPSRTENSVNTVAFLAFKPVIPSGGCADQIGIFAQRCQRKLCLVVRDELATARDGAADFFQEQDSAF